MRIIAWNVNGIRAGERKGFLPWLAGCRADVVALQEIKAAPEQLSATLREPAGYYAHWLPAWPSRRPCARLYALSWPPHTAPVMSRRARERQAAKPNRRQ